MGLALLGLDGLLWALLIGSDMPTNVGNIIELVLIWVAVFGGLGLLGWRFPFILGLLLIVPVAFPLGLGTVGLGLSDESTGSEEAGLLAWLVGAPLLIGLVFVAAGVVGFWKRRASRTGPPLGPPLPFSAPPIGVVPGGRGRAPAKSSDD